MDIIIKLRNYKCKITYDHHYRLNPYRSYYFYISFAASIGCYYYISQYCYFYISQLSFTASISCYFYSLINTLTLIINNDDDDDDDDVHT